ncbi:MAG: IS1634 family transposase [Halanaerobiales bacterium]
MAKSNYKFVEERTKVILPGFMASANAFMDKINFVEIINDAVVWDEKQWQVSPGVLLKAVVLNTFTNVRTPLYQIGQAFNEIDTEHLFGKGITPKMITDSAIGKALDRVHAANAGKLFHTLSLTVFKKYEIEINRLHSDTTSISFYGDYEKDPSSSNQDNINIVRGHNKDHRPGCKQMKIGQISNEAGIMVSCNSLDGNTSDVTWNKEALELIKELQQKFTMIGDAIYVADCKLMTQNLFLKMNDEDDGILFISRVPARFDSKLESRIREKAFQENNWYNVGKLNDTKKACSYKIQDFTEEVYGQQTRLVVVQSSASLASFKASQRKKKSQIEKAIKDLNKERFACKKDAMASWEGFWKKYKKAPYIFSLDLQEIRTEKRPRGNPGKNPKPPTVIIEWALNIKIDRVDRKAYRLLRHKAESFVLISNVPESIATATRILKIYKGQIVVELNFKIMKSPALTSTVFLEKEERIEAMMMLIGVSLMIRALMLYKLREGFKESGEHPKIGYSGIALKTVTMGLFQYAMGALSIEKQKDGDYHIHVMNPKQKLRATTLLRYMGLEISDLL